MSRTDVRCLVRQTPALRVIIETENYDDDDDDDGIKTSTLQTRR